MTTPMTASTDAGKPAGHTPGPWAWFGNEHGVYLATTHSGRRCVMQFRRRGLNGAEPMFQVGNWMVPASKLVEFEVGDQTARGFEEGRRDPSVYRMDICGIDCPDARLIAAAPALLEALKELLHATCGETGFANAVRAVSDTAYPWPALDIAEERARALLSEIQP